MAEIVFAFPGSLDTPTGGYRYDRRIIAELRRHHTVTLLPLNGDFPEASQAEAIDAAQALNAVDPAASLIVDGLAFGQLPGEQLAVRARLVALVHHPLALETGLAPERAATLRRTERTALEQADAVVVTSPSTKAMLTAEFGVPEAAITVALPGLDGQWFEVARALAQQPLIVSVGSVTPRKGHDVLVAALARLHEVPFSCVIVGSTELSPDTTRRLRQSIAQAGLGERVSLAGALPEAEIMALYAGAHVFALATRYEGFGMVFAEAMAAGLPVVGCRGGAVADVVPPDAGLLVEVDDDAALAEALQTVLADRERAAAMGAAGRRAARAMPEWAHSARTIADVALGIGA